MVTLTDSPPPPVAPDRLTDALDLYLVEVLTAAHALRRRVAEGCPDAEPVALALALVEVEAVGRRLADVFPLIP